MTDSFPVKKLAISYYFEFISASREALISSVVKKKY